ncbi:MAG: zinc-binding dehydrogenase, partial [bacterium]
ATAIASTYSPRALIVIGAPDDRLNLARRWGANATISIDAHPAPTERIEMVRELTDGRGADVIIEVAGVAGAFSEGVEMAARNARYVLVGNVGAPSHPVAAHHITNRQITVVGSSGGHIDAYYKAMEFLVANEGRFDWHEMLGDRYQLDNISEALQRMESGDEIKPVILTRPD